VWELERVENVTRPLGTPEPATVTDADLLVRWFIAFETEATAEHEPPSWDDTRTALEARLRGQESGAWVWRVDYEPVSIAGFGGPTGRGIRIGPVYTPPERRRRGYATALVADLSSHLLASGYERCFLYTDLANATAGRIYASIGYRRIAESKMLAFER